MSEKYGRKPITNKDFEEFKKLREKVDGAKKRWYEAFHDNSVSGEEFTELTREYVKAEREYSDKIDVHLERI
ncbi:MAG: hypothetical protein IBX64_10000 [Actinobacteria bacterium]|nr:hypothetical protein [Actinomycetota bacterium]